MMYNLQVTELQRTAQGALGKDGAAFIWSHVETCKWEIRTEMVGYLGTRQPGCFICCKCALGVPMPMFWSLKVSVWRQCGG